MGLSSRNALSEGTSVNLAPIESVLASFVLIYIPRIFVARAQARDPAGYDNRNPRDQQLRLDGLGKRAQGAHQNSFEAFAPFAAAVLSTYATGAVDRYPLAMTALPIAFVLVRSLYIVLYLADRHTLRSAVWTVGMLLVASIFILAVV
ncbi:MAG: MAPEG family protein [Polyangiales bacterium]